MNKKFKSLFILMLSAISSGDIYSAESNHILHKDESGCSDYLFPSKDKIFDIHKDTSKFLNKKRELETILEDKNVIFPNNKIIINISPEDSVEHAKENVENIDIFIENKNIIPGNTSPDTGKDKKDEFPDCLCDFGKITKIGKGMQGTVYESSLFKSIVIKKINTKPELKVVHRLINNDTYDLAKNCKFLMRVRKVLDDKDSKSRKINYIVYDYIPGIILCDEYRDWITCRRNNCKCNCRGKNLENCKCQGVKVSLNTFLDWCKGLFGALKIFYQVTGLHLKDVRGYNIIMEPVENNEFQPVIIDYGKIVDENTASSNYEKSLGIRGLADTLLTFFQKGLIDYGSNSELYNNLKVLLSDIKRSNYDYDEIISKLNNINTKI